MDATQTAELAVDESRRELTATWPELVKTVIWYGAVDIDVKHLVVWVVLNGPSDELPEWFFPSRNLAVDQPLAKGKLDEVTAMSAVVRRAFAEHNWPRPDVRVGFDSDERIAESGGWHYFK